jgi:hypothetical protein
VAGQTFVEPAARTASGDSGPQTGFGDESTLRAQLNVTAAAGTGPTLDVVLEDTLDGTNWNVVGTFAQKTAPGREVVNVTTPFADRLRARWTVAGTAPSFTFDVVVYSE